MAIEWGTIIVWVLLIFLVLAVIAKISGQTLVEFLKSASGWLKGTSDDGFERAVEIY